MLGNRLKTLRKTRGMTQADVGEALGISASAVGMYEQGRREPNNETLAAFCKLFEVSSDYFLLEKPAKKQPILQNPELGAIIEDFRQMLLSQEGLMFNGVPLSESDVAQVVSAIEVGTMVAVNKLDKRKTGGFDGTD